MVIESITGYKFVIQFKKISVDSEKINKIYYVLNEIMRPMDVDREMLQKALMEEDEEVLKVLENDVTWDELLWDTNRLSVRERVFTELDNVMFLPRPELQIENESNQE